MSHNSKHLKYSEGCCLKCVEHRFEVLDSVPLGTDLKIKDTLDFWWQKQTLNQQIKEELNAKTNLFLFESVGVVD